MDIEELMKDEAFAAELEKAFAANDAEQIKALFASRGFEITDEGITAAMKARDEEMSEEDLDNVAGGGVFSRLSPSWFRNLKPVGPVKPINPFNFWRKLHK